MTGDACAIRARGLSKRYRIGAAARATTLRDRLAAAAAAPLRRVRRALRGDASGVAGLSGELWALRDVSFDVAPGEVLGIVGENGAGKSTLLRILAGITEPTCGWAEIRGRLGSLLEVGVGFHPELTGRENIFLAGAILGMRRSEIRAKVDEIIAFAEVEALVDTPVKFFSSGMRLRLGFAVAAHLEAEILLTDEVLAVGDARFQRKCLGAMGAGAHAGRTVLFVSHQMDMIRAVCTRCLWLDGGRLVRDGEPGCVVDAYLASGAELGERSHFEVDPDPRLPLQILAGSLAGPGGVPRARFDVFEPVRVELEYEAREDLEGTIVCLEVYRDAQLLLQSFDTDTEPGRIEKRPAGRYRACVELPSPLLKPGRYTISCVTGIARRRKLQYLEHVLAFDVELVSKPSAFLSFGADRPGAVASYLPWETERKR